MEIIIKSIMDIKITLPTPILVMSLAAPTIFNAFFRLPVCANLASPMAWKNEKIKNIIIAAEMVIVKETINGKDT